MRYPLMLIIATALAASTLPASAGPVCPPGTAFYHGGCHPLVPPPQQAQPAPSGSGGGAISPWLRPDRPHTQPGVPAPWQKGQRQQI